jgi:hypothetical protein
MTLMPIGRLFRSKAPVLEEIKSFFSEHL